MSKILKTLGVFLLIGGIIVSFALGYTFAIVEKVSTYTTRTHYNYVVFFTGFISSLLLSSLIYSVGSIVDLLQDISQGIYHLNTKADNLYNEIKKSKQVEQPQRELWRCSCGAGNDIDKDTCWKCEKPRRECEIKEDGESMPKDMWRCSCGAWNAIKDSCCWKCKEPKSE